MALLRAGTASAYDAARGCVNPLANPNPPPNHSKRGSRRESLWIRSRGRHMVGRRVAAVTFRVLTRNRQSYHLRSAPRSIRALVYQLLTWALNNGELGGHEPRAASSCVTTTAPTNRLPARDNESAGGYGEGASRRQTTAALRVILMQSQVNGAPVHASCQV